VQSSARNIPFRAEKEMRKADSVASAVLIREFDGSTPTMVHGGKGYFHIAADESFG
jgi:hypothetical protein